MASIEENLVVWAVNPARSIAMSFLPKCGTVSMNRSLLVPKLMTNKEVRIIPSRIAWLRNPLERIKSNFFWLKGLYGKSRFKYNVLFSVPRFLVVDWPTFVNHVLSEPNILWNPHVEMLTDGGVYCPTKVERFEDLSYRFKHYMGEDLPVWNTSKKFEIPLYREVDIEEKYAADFTLWGSLNVT